MRWLYEYLEKNGVNVDRQNKNPARLSRMPGATRNGVLQELEAVNLGPRSWDEWKEQMEDDALPPVVHFSDVIDQPDMRKPWLIDNLLRETHKMLLAGPSKAGKSMFLMELACAVASGGKFLGWQCHKAKVLYINLEIDPASAIHRFQEITAKANERGCADNLDILNMRGLAEPLDKLTDRLIRKARGYGAIVIDPIYKIITGDENSASDMAYFCNQFDRLSKETGACVIYCHHHSKGAQGGKKAQDRASGSGVFARDPDVQLDLIELVVPECDQAKVFDDENGSAWQIEGSIREAAPLKPKKIFFYYPIHVEDVNGVLDKYYPEGSRGGNLDKSSRKAGYKITLEVMQDAWREALKGDGANYVTIKDFSDMLPRNKKGDAPSYDSIHNWVDKYPEVFSIQNGLVFMKEEED